MNLNFTDGNEDEIENILGKEYINMLKLKACSGSMNNDILNINNNETNENGEASNNELMNKKFNQSGQYKRLYDFYNNKNSFQHYLKKLKTCRIDADEFRNILEKHLVYECENPMFKTHQEDDKKGICGSESNSSSSNYEGLHYYKRINFYNKNRNKSKNKNRKRKRIASKIDKKFLIKCRTCKFINSNGLKIEDYYTCQNCGDNDFSVIRSSSPNNINSSMDK